MKRILPLLVCLLFSLSLISQDYFYKDFGPFDPSIPSPEAFLGYEIGDYHTRHDRIVAYLEALAAASDRASLIDYGKTHELRRLVILQISDPSHLQNIEAHRQEHLQLINPDASIQDGDLVDLPVFVNLAYNVHGNEPSGGEASMLAAYVLTASNHPDIERYRRQAIVFLDPVINPDGRDRHSQWANSHRSSVLNADPMDSEHNEMWPRGRTNHYWFDLNRDWLLLVHPESQGKLDWYHKWYPNVVTDFHEMGSNSSYFFEPMKAIGSKDPIMPIENYTTLNDTFALYFQREMDKLGSLYFTKEVFDGTYPGYGSSYPDLQGGLGILFEQASSRGHVQNTDMGQITFPFTIRNQFVNSIATVEASVKHKKLLYAYQQEFFKSAIANANKSKVKAYVFGEEYDQTRLQAFVDLLLSHQIKVYELDQTTRLNGQSYQPGKAYIVPTAQAQYRMVQTMFETYSEYQDSVFYDASAWSLANAYNMKYAAASKMIGLGKEVSKDDLAATQRTIPVSNYAYIIGWEDYNAPALLYHLQSKGVRVMASQKPFTIPTSTGDQSFAYGSLVIPLQKQKIDSDELREVLLEAANEFQVDVHAATTGYSRSGIDLGSRYVSAVEKPKTVMLTGDGTSSYEVGFVWHLLDQRVKMPITKLQTRLFGRADLSKYNTMVLVSGSYNNLDSTAIQKIKDWVSEGNTLITFGRATAWAIGKKLVKESLVKEEKDEKREKKDTTERKRYDYVQASEIRGRDGVGGVIFEIDLDITHPLGYGYRDRQLPIYRNNKVWIAPSKNEFSNVAMYTEDPHIDGFITDDNLNKFLKKSASIVVSRAGQGRVVLFAEDPNFRGTWYGTNKLFLNALFFGELIRVP
ncbi:MAG: zinc carboxypeptidase [Saprospiraceae bacterium]|nr:zinc carboxypeptidase [Saprospiraceae bacterium]